MPEAVVVADPAAAVAAGTPAPTPAPRPEPDPEDEEHDGVTLTPQQQATRSRRRMERSLDTWKGRAQIAETELSTLRQQNAALQAQVGSVSQLRTSLLQTAIRAQAATMVVPEAIDDAVTLLQSGDLTVGDDGKIDQAKVKAALDEFVKNRPHMMPRSTNAPQPLPGGHTAPPTGGNGHADINDLLRRQLHR
jgi:multidrug efflux pump subunit AcrA (membrane-fusion protein)